MGTVWVFITFLLVYGEVNDTLMSGGHPTEAECIVELEDFKEMAGELLLDTDIHSIAYTDCEEYNDDDITFIIPGLSI